MIQFINRDMGTIMYVDESRKEEYLAAGHKLAADVTLEKPEKARPAAKKRRTKE